MSTGLIVFARLDSRRLPGKALVDLGGRPLLGRVLDRVRRVGGGQEIVVATSGRTIDDAIAELAAAEGATVFRGATDDVAGRALACAERHGFERFARVSCDSPFVDPELIARLIALGNAEDLDLATNVFPRSFPPGCSVEVIATAALRRACGAMEDEEDKEHLTRYFYRHPEGFRIFNLAATEGRYEGVRLTVDDARDLTRAAWILEPLVGPAEAAALDEVVALARAWELEGGAAAGLASVQHA